MPESTAVSLEAFSLGYASVCCFFYGLLGVATVCTTTCTSSDGDEYSKSIKITPILASFYCSIVILLGYFLWKFRYSTEAVGSYVQNTSFHLSTLSTQGHQHLTMSIRLAFSLILVFIIVVVIARNILLKPLTQGCDAVLADKTSCCTSLPQEQNPMMFSVRTTLKRLEPWIVGSGFAFLFISLAFNWKEKTTFEKEARKKVYGEEPPTVRATPVAPQVTPQGVQLKAGVEEKPAAAKTPSVTQAQQASNPAHQQSVPSATNPKYEQQRDHVFTRGWRQHYHVFTRGRRRQCYNVFVQSYTRGHDIKVKDKFESIQIGDRHSHGEARTVRGEARTVRGEARTVRGETQCACELSS